MGLRTRFIDDEVLRALAAGVGQFVVIGAGFDGRALRFRQPGVRWFELDHPATLPDKQRRVREATRADVEIRFAPVDLLRDDVGATLRSVGHDPARASLFICEGLFTYLPNDVVRALCGRLRGVAGPGSTLVASTLVVPEPRASAQVVVDALLRLLGEQRLGIFHRGTVEAMMSDQGWTILRQDTSRHSRLSGSHLLLLAAEAR